MDFVVCLSKTRIQRDSIWVIVDKISKSAHVILVNSTNRVEDYAKLYIDEIVRLNVIPFSIISDRGSQFNLYLRRSFQKSLGLQVKLSTALHFSDLWDDRAHHSDIGGHDDGVCD